MAKARCLLRETNKNVIEIGLAAGSTSPSHFTQIFQRETGVLPTS
jgi:AraC family transcriptional regulator